MPIDGIKSGAPAIHTAATTEVQKPKPSAPPPAAKPTEAFTEAKKKPLSITGKFNPPPPVKSDRADLKELVANQHMMVMGGVMGGPSQRVATGEMVGNAAPPPDAAAVREAMNAKPPDLEVLRRGIAAGVLENESPHMKGVALEQLRAGGSDADKEAMVDLVKSCKSKAELRDVVSVATKKGDPKGYVAGQADFHKYDQLMTDAHPYLIADRLNPDSKVLPETLAKPADPNSISNRFHIDNVKEFPAQPGDAKVSLAPGDEAARRKFIDKMTQIDSQRTDPSMHENGCAPTAIIVSCMQQADPKAAMSKLCDQNLKLAEAAGPASELAKREGFLKGLKAKIDKGEPITRDDVNKLQEATYLGLQQTERSMGGDASNQTVSLGAVKKFMTDSGIGYSGGVPALVDTDGATDKYGKRSTEHFVLINEQKGEVFDPWPRVGGHQLVRRDGMGGGYADAGAYDTYRRSILEPAQPLMPVID